MEALRVSPSDVVKLALPLKELYELQDNPPIEASRKGMLKHKELFNAAQLRLGLTLPGFASNNSLIKVQNDVLLFPEEIHSVALDDRVVATTQVDIVIGSNICGEVKPTLKGRHALQLMMTTMIFAASTHQEHVDGILYFYNEQQYPKVMGLVNGGAEYWDDGANLLKWAAEILHTQQMIDQQEAIRKKQKNTGKAGNMLFSRNIGWEQINEQRSVFLRQKFDACIESIKKPLAKLLKT